jgi:hypothetical protein
MHYTLLNFVYFTLNLLKYTVFIMMEQYDNGVINVNTHAVEPKTYRRLIPPLTLPSISVVLIFVGLMSTYPVHATTGADTETAVTTAPGGASVGPAGNGTNVTDTRSEMQSACLPQNATTTTTTGSPPVNGSGANATATNNTTATFAPSGASIGVNETSTLNATTGNTTTTTNNTTATFAPSGASVC